MSPPPPTPAKMRAPISAYMVGAVAHRSVPTVKNASATSSAFLRPSASANRPYTGVKQHSDKRYAVPSQLDR